MPLIRGPYGGADARGSASSNVFSRNRTGAYVRGRVTPVNPQTPAQVVARQALAILSFNWVSVLTPSQRLAWDDYALGTPIPNALGDEAPTSGRQMYIRGNAPRISAGLLPVNDAPTTPGVAPPPVYTLTGDTADGVEATLVLPILALNDVVNFRLGIAVNQTRNFYSSPFRTALVAVSATVFPVTLRAAVDVAIGQRYFVESRFFASDGKTSFLVRQNVDILV